jgi:hypothetical protein
VSTVLSGGYAFVRRCIVKTYWVDTAVAQDRQPLGSPAGYRAAPAEFVTKLHRESSDFGAGGRDERPGRRSSTLSSRFA